MLDVAAVLQRGRVTHFFVPPKRPSWERPRVARFVFLIGYIGLPAEDREDTGHGWEAGRSSRENGWGDQRERRAPAEKWHVYRQKRRGRRKEA
jgi:hypothetical protein